MNYSHEVESMCTVQKGPNHGPAPIPEEGREKRKRMTKLQIISKLWSAIYDLVFLVKGTPTKSLEEIEADLDIVEYACRKYADCDDDEITFESRGGTAYADTSRATEVD